MTYYNDLEINDINFDSSDDEDDIPFEELHSKPPLAKNSLALTIDRPTIKLNSFIKFQRCSIIPYAHYKDDIIFFFNVYRGLDDDNFVEELSDFGGTCQNVETFMETACYETFEESLGIFNFMFQDNEIAASSTAICSLDRSIIILLLPVNLTDRPNKIIESFIERRNKLSQYEPESIKYYLNRYFNRSLVAINTPEKVDKDWDKEHLFRERISPINIDESSDILYINGKNLLKLLEGKNVKTPAAISITTEYKYYPQIYPVVASRLLQSKFLIDLILNTC